MKTRAQRKQQGLQFREEGKSRGTQLQEIELRGGEIDDLLTQVDEAESGPLSNEIPNLTRLLQPHDIESTPIDKNVSKEDDSSNTSSDSEPEEERQKWNELYKKDFEHQTQEALHEIFQTTQGVESAATPEDNETDDSPVEVQLV